MSNFIDWLIEQNKNSNITKVFSGANISQVIQDWELKNNSIKNKIIQPPKSNPAEKSSLKKLLSNPWVIGLTILWIEEITFGKIWKFIVYLYNYLF